MNRFFVPVKPRPWQRARKGRGKREFFNTKEIKAYKSAVSMWARQSKVSKLEGPVFLLVRCLWPSKKPDRVRSPREPEFRSTAKKDDADNMAKAVMDALSDVAYHDDGQVCLLATTKEYAAQGAPCGLIVYVGPLGSLLETVLTVDFAASDVRLTDRV